MATQKSRRSSLLALLPLAVLCPSLARALEFNDKYTGPNNGNYSASANWDLTIVPNNAGPVLFNVSIPAGGTTVNFDKVSPGLLEAIVKSFTLGNNSTFQLLPGTKYTVQEQAEIYGILKVNGGQFIAMGTGAGLAGDRARISVSNGAVVRIGAASYSSAGLYGTSGEWPTTRVHTFDLMTVSDPNSKLDLSSVRSFNANFTSPSYNDTTQRVTASNGGTIDLSGLRSIMAPVSGADRLVFTISDEAKMNKEYGGQEVMNLQGLQTITTNGSGKTQLAITQSTLSLPSLKTVNFGQFVLDAGATVKVDAGQLSQVSNTTFTLKNGSRFITLPGEGTMTYSSAGLYGTSGEWPTTRVHTFDLMTVSDPNSKLDLSSVRSFNANFTSPSYNDTTQRVTASNGGTIDLSGLQSIMAPVSGADRLVFAAAGGSTLLLGHLRTISNGSATVSFNVTGDSQVDLGSLQATYVPTSITLSGGSTAAVQSLRASASSSTISASGSNSIVDAPSLSGFFGTTSASAADSAQLTLGDLKLAAATTITLNKATATLGGLRAPKGAPASTVTLKDASDRLEITNSLALGSEIALSAPKGATISLGRDFTYQHTDETKAQIGSANLNFTGNALQQVEVGGLDIDVFTPLLTNDNFGLGRVTIGTPNQPTIVELRDGFDNGNRAGQPREALYLFGPDGRTGPDVSATNALQLNGGSHLVLHNLNAYARQGQDGWVRLQDLLKSTDRRVAYGDGFLSRTLSDVAGAWDADADGSWSNQNSWFQPQDAHGNAIFGSKATAPRTITVDQPATVSFLAFDNANAYTLTGPASITLAGPRATIRVEHDNGNGNHRIATELKLAANLDLINNSTGTLDLAGRLDNTQGKKLLKTGPGLVTLTGPQSHAKGAALIAQDGTLRLDTDAGSASSRTASLEAAGGKILLTTSQHVAGLYAFDGTIELAAGHNKVIITDDVSAGIAGKVDLMDNALIVRSTVSEQDVTLQMLASQARSSFAASKRWQGPGLASSTAAAFPKSLTGLAVLINDDGKGHTLRSQIFGQPTTINDILAIYTWNGDANLDGSIDAADYFLIDSGYITQQGGYRHGDFNYDGLVDAADYFLIDSAYIGQKGVLNALAPVPEPATLLPVLASFLLARRRKS